MEKPATGELDGSRLDKAYAEATQLVSYVANQLRAITESYREHYGASLAGRYRDRGAPVASLDAGPVTDDLRAGLVKDADTEPGHDAVDEIAPEELGRRQLELAKLELAVTHLERTWLFLQPGDATLVPGPAVPDLPTDLQMRIVEAQEWERQRLAQEVHDGPAQALTNAIFQVEYIERLLERDSAAARSEMRFLRDLLRRELADVRTFITQLRPPLLDDIGLNGAIRDHASNLEAATGAQVDVSLAAPPEALGDMQQTVVLRIVQEALQNIRRHAEAEHVRIVTRLEPEPDRDWILEIHDDGRGFDPAQMSPARGLRSFGLRFMRERADLIDARLRIDARPGGGTHIYVTLPGGTERR